MKKIKIAIVDSDLLSRHALSGILQNDDEFDVAGVSEVLNDISVGNPDVLIYNIESLNTEEFSAFINLRRRLSDLPIVVLAKRTESGAEAAIEALQLGAVDVITKPRDCTGLLFARRHLLKRVVPIVRNAANTSRDMLRQLIANEKQAYPFIPNVKEIGETEIRTGVRIVVVGSCTGGPAALFSLIPALPEELRAPVIVAQHFPKKYTHVLAKELNKHSTIKVREAFDGAELGAGSVWIAPGGMHTEICHGDFQRMILRTHRGPRESGNRPSIDTLFRSASGMFGSEALGVVLSGIGKDGVAGAGAVRHREGQLLVQNPEEALAAELPLSMLHTGLAEQYYSIEELGNQIVKRCGLVYPKDMQDDQHDLLNSAFNEKESVKNLELNSL